MISLQRTHILKWFLDARGAFLAVLCFDFRLRGAEERNHARDEGARGLNDWLSVLWRLGAETSDAPMRASFGGSLGSISYFQVLRFWK